MRRIEHFNDPDAPTANRLVPAASAIVVDQAGRILLHRRTDNELWSIPGGEWRSASASPTPWSARSGRRPAWRLEVGFFTPAEIETMPMHESIRLRILHYLEHRTQPVIA